MSVFQEEYRELSASEKEHIAEIKRLALNLFCMYPQTVDQRGASREISLAMTALEESVMWAVKGITKLPQNNQETA